MKPVKKYYYNTTTHRFEKLVVPLRKKLIQILGFFSASLVTGLIIAALAFRFLGSPTEKKSKQVVYQLQDEYSSFQQNYAALNKSLHELEQRDNQIYRVIFESAPLPDSLRYGKSYDSLSTKKYAYTSSDNLMEEMRLQVTTAENRIKTQSKSYDTLEQMVKAKEEMLAHIPAIQPVSNKDLSHIASGFGYRIDPVYKTPKMHTGLDFAAPTGTPIYATANATVDEATASASGYGNHVVLDHGFGYKTLYGHMVRMKVHGGEVIKRGQIIGWVGSTGKSTGPHCHYEVIKNGEKIDPVHYFFNDLSATDYERFVKIAASANQSFD